LYKILYVADGPELLEYLPAYLESHGEFEVNTAVCIEEALEKLKGDGYDIIIYEWQDTGSNVLHFLKYLREIDIVTPLILLTGREREEAVIEALNNGADFYLEKEGDPEALFADLRKLIERSIKKSETIKALKQSEQNFRTLVELARDGIVVVQDERVKYLNAAMANLLGYAVDEMLHADPRRFIPPEEYAKIIDLYNNLPAGEDIPPEFETVLSHKSGKAVPVEIGATSIDYEGRGAVLYIIRDVTERKNAEMERARTLALLEAIFESTDDGILVVDRCGETIRFNRRFLELWKIPESYTSLNAEERLHLVREQLRDPESFVADVKRLLFDDPAAECVDILEFKDGRIIERYSRPLVIDGKIAGRIWSFRDITERQMLEDALRRSEELYRTVFENTGTAMAIIEEDMTISLVNDEFTRLTGYSREEIEGKMKSPDLVAKEEVRRVIEYHRARRKNPSKTPGSYELELMCKSGKTRIAKVTIDVIPGTKRSIVSLIDITEEKKLKEELIQQKEEFELLLDGIDTMVWYAVDPETYGRANRARAEFLGKKKEEIEGRKLWEFLPRDEAEIGIMGNRIVFERKKKYRDFEWFTNWKGEKRLMLVTKIPKLDKEGNVEYALCTAEDVTELKKAQDDLALANRKLQILGGMTRHDILNQLTVLEGYAELLKDYIADERGTEILDKVRHASERIGIILERQREYEKLGSRELEWIRVKELFDEAVRTVTLGGISLEVDLEGLEIFADHLVGRVFHNLLENSVKHGKKLSRIRVHVREGEDGITIFYEDDGVGIPDHLKETIFEMKGALHALPMAREILSLTGLTIKETGIYGEGARFEIFVPEGKYRYRS